MFSRRLAANSLSLTRTPIKKISGRPPPMIPTAILIESGSVMRMAWQKNSINLSMSFLPAELKAWPQLNLRASRQEASKHGHEKQATTACTDIRVWPLADIQKLAGFSALEHLKRIVTMLPHSIEV